MSTRSTALFPLGVALAIGVLVAPAGSHEAQACGIVLSRTASAPVPSLTRENVLLVYDEAQGVQHFVREVAFRGGDARFGFVVPTPTRPEVASVSTSPFAALRERFAWAGGIGEVGGRGVGAPADEAEPRAGVEILERTRVGSFTAFVLAASDEAALGEWLHDNGLVHAPGTEEWLSHYVRRGFFYVAMRHDPAPASARAASDDDIATETVRISFPTPVPYYPYREPEPTTRPDPWASRSLDLWFVGSHAVVPVAAKQTGDDVQWVKPWRPGLVYADARADVLAALPDELDDVLPAGELVVQTFRETKVARPGFGDVLFGNLEPRPIAADRRAALASMVSILDPALEAAP